jgi:hypothetical protein
MKTKRIETIAGNGKGGKPSDGALATDSPLTDPRAAVVDRKGNLYILERGGHALRLWKTSPGTAAFFFGASVVITLWRA